MASTTRITAGPVELAGVSYLPDKIEVEMDDEIVARVELEFLDFLKSLTDIMKLMHMIKTKHLRTLQPIPLPVLREMMVLDNTGHRFKAWEKMCSGAQPGISTSVENIFRAGVSSVSMPTTRNKPVYRKEKKRKTGLDNDLIEITGKKTKPLWHVLALENPSNDIGPLQTTQRRNNTIDDFSLAGLLDKRSRPINRSRSDQLLVNIKALAGFTKVKATKPVFESQMAMMMARDAGFTSVTDHKAYLDTQKPHWYKDLLMDAYKMGILYKQEIIEAFENLGKYYETTNTSISLSKPKICFLMMSLPVWDVCQAAFQRAMDYFLYVVLQLNNDVNILSEWLKVRKLPYLVHEPLSAELAFLQEMPYAAPAPPLESNKKTSL